MIRNNSIGKKSVDQSQKDDMIMELEKQNDDILKTIMIFDNKFDISYLKNNYSSLYQNIIKSWQSMKENITRNMMKAYYDLLCDDILKGNNTLILLLFQDIQIKINNKYDASHFINKFKINNLVKILEKSEFNTELVELILLITDLINKSEMWKSHIISLIKNPYHINLPKILIDLIENL